jgi:acyl-CoA synthetase (AMP-forming)/AMP-acid ligase II/acyl carrier protein
VLLGGESILMRDIQKWLSSTNCNGAVVNTYGPTECTDVVAFYKIDKNNYTDKVPIGRPINNTNLYIISENDFEKDITGELYIGGIAVGEGYREMPELTAEKFICCSDIQEELLYRTGDVVEKLEDNNLVFVGRVDEQVKINGYRIELGEIESVLSNHPNIKQAVLKVHATKDGISNLCVYVVFKEHTEFSLIKDYLNKSLPNYMIPTHFIEMTEFPLNTHGKINKQELPLPTEKCEGETLNNNSGEELNDTQKKAFEVIVSVLKEKIFDIIPIDLNIIDIDSITFIKAVVALEGEFDFEFDDEMLLISKFPTIKSIVDYVESKTVLN